VATCSSCRHGSGHGSGEDGWWRVEGASGREWWCHGVIVDEGVVMLMVDASEQSLKAQQKWSMKMKSKNEHFWGPFLSSFSCSFKKKFEN